MEIVVFSEQPAELLVLVGAADLLRREPAHVPVELRLVFVVADALLEEVDSLDHPLVAAAIVVELSRDVVRGPPRLESPDGDEVGFQLGDLLERGGEIGPVLLFVVAIGLLPEDVGRHAAHPERGQLDRFAGGVDLPEFRLAQSVLASQLRQFAALPASHSAGGRHAEIQKRQHENADHQQVGDLAIERASGGHRATSRVLRKKCAATKTGSRNAKALTSRIRTSSGETSNP